MSKWSEREKPGEKKKVPCKNLIKRIRYRGIDLTNMMKVINGFSLTLYNLMDCRPPGSSVLGILQTTILEWVAISYSRGSSWPMDWTHIYYISCMAEEFFSQARGHLGSPPYDENLYPKNYKTLIMEIEDGIKKWKDTPCSYISRINIVKVVIFPKAIKM